MWKYAKGISWQLTSSSPGCLMNVVLSELVGLGRHAGRWRWRWRWRRGMAGSRDRGRGCRGRLAREESAGGAACAPTATDWTRATSAEEGGTRSSYIGAEDRGGAHLRSTSRAAAACCPPRCDWVARPHRIHFYMFPLLGWIDTIILFHARDQDDGFRIVVWWPAIESSWQCRMLQQLIAISLPISLGNLFVKLICNMQFIYFFKYNFWTDTEKE